MIANCQLPIYLELEAKNLQSEIGNTKNASLSRN